MAAYNLGLLLAEHGDFAGARDAFRMAADSSHSKAASRALGELKPPPPNG